MLLDNSNKICEYVKHRASFEGVGFELTPEFFDTAFKRGIRMFFGVHVDNNFNMLIDEQEPCAGFLNSWSKKSNDN